MKEDKVLFIVALIQQSYPRSARTATSFSSPCIRIAAITKPLNFPTGTQELLRRLRVHLELAPILRLFPDAAVATKSPDRAGG